MKIQCHMGGSLEYLNGPFDKPYFHFTHLIFKLMVEVTPKPELNLAYSEIHFKVLGI